MEGGYSNNTESELHIVEGGYSKKIGEWNLNCIYGYSNNTAVRAVTARYWLVTILSELHIVEGGYSNKTAELHLVEGGYSNLNCILWGWIF